MTASLFGRGVMYNSKRMDTLIENNVKFYNLRKLAAAKLAAKSGLIEDIITEYEKLGGKFDLVITEPEKKVVKKTATNVVKKAIKKVTKKTSAKKAKK